MATNGHGAGTDAPLANGRQSARSDGSSAGGPVHGGLDAGRRRDRRRLLGLLAAGGASAWLAGCEGDDAGAGVGTGVGEPAATPLSGRILGVVPTETPDGDFGADVIAPIVASGATTTLSVYRDQIETAPGVYAPEPNFLRIADLVYPSAGLAVNLTVSVIDTSA